MKRYDDNDLYWFWLSNIEGIGKIKMNRLLDHALTPYNLYKMSEEQISQCEGITTKDVASIMKSKKYELIEKEYQKIKNYNSKFITPQSEYYPENLKYLCDKPFNLYYKGSVPKNERPIVAIVGARACTEYGKWIAYKLAKELSENGIDIISGMALGIDTAAHNGCIAGGGKTFAVLGCGLDICYPKSNIELYMQIQKQGGLISEYKPDTKPLQAFFPMRNRIISGIADAVIVVEARKKSGSLITADIALEQNKDVFAVPGRAGDLLSEGTNNLIKQGAYVITEAMDILQSYIISEKLNNFIEKPEKNKEKTDILQPLLNESSENILAREKNMVYSCFDLYPKCLDEIKQETGLEIEVITENILMLQLEEKITEVSKNCYVKSGGKNGKISGDCRISC